MYTAVPCQLQSFTRLASELPSLDVNPWFDYECFHLAYALLQWLNCNFSLCEHKPEGEKDAASQL